MMTMRDLGVLTNAPEVMMRLAEVDHRARGPEHKGASTASIDGG